MIPYGSYPDPATIKRVLVIKLRHHGDVLLTTPVFSCLRKALPDVQVDAFIYQETAPMLAGNPDIGELHCYDGGWKAFSPLQRLGREIQLAQKIRRQRYDVAINLTEGDRGALAALFSGAKIRVGWDPGGEGFVGKKKIYTHIIKRSARPRHMVEQNLDAIRILGIFPTPEDRDLRLEIPDQARATFGQRLAGAGIAPQSYLLIHPTSRWLFKCWPLEHNIALIRSLQEKNIPIVLTAAPDPQELHLIDRIVAACGTNNLLDLGGQLSLKELAAAIDSCRCLFTIDSVPMHMAAARKKPTVVLFGPSSENAWGPWRNPKARVITAPYSCRPCNLDGCGGGKVCDCLTGIPVSAVLDRITALW